MGRLLDSTALIEVFCLRRPLQNSFFSCAQVFVQTSRLSCFSSLRYTSRSEVQFGSSTCLIKCMREEALSDHRLQIPPTVLSPGLSFASVAVESDGIPTHG